jgi:hypothetical protein
LSTSSTGKLRIVYVAGTKSGFRYARIVRSPPRSICRRPFSSSSTDVFNPSVSP